MRPQLHLNDHNDDDDQPFRIYSPTDLKMRGPTRPCSPEPEVRAPRTVPLRVVKPTPTRSSEPSGIVDPTLTEAAVAQRAAVPPETGAVIPRTIEDELIAILTGPPLPGDTIEVTYKRKEHELGAVFARLSWVECRTLHKRLSTPRAEDALATHFARLVESRRARLLAFLDSAHRREAIAACRR